MIMNWIKNNALTLVVVLVTLVSNYAIYGYRIDAIEKRVTANELSIEAQRQNNVVLQVGLAKIQTDIEYIKLRVDHKFP